MLNVRLNKEEEENLHRYCDLNKVSKTQVVKEALATYFTRSKSEESVYELGEGLFGTVGSGDSDRSSTYKSKLKQKLREKHTH